MPRPRRRLLTLALALRQLLHRRGIFHQTCGGVDLGLSVAGIAISLRAANYF